MNIALCFCVRNCETYLPYIFKNIERLQTLNVNVYSIFVFDNCTDNSERLLRDYHLKHMDSVVVKHIRNTSPYRTVRIANARNACLDVVYNKLENISYHIMIDADDVNSNPWNIKVIQDYLTNFDNDNWDCISFHRKHYYDIWALLYDNFKHHCWGFGDKSKQVVQYIQKNITDRLNSLEVNSMYVMSAFNGFCIYRTDRFEGFHYDGLYENVKQLFTDSERKQTLDVLTKNNIQANIFDYISKEWMQYGLQEPECCEHIFYHLSAYRKQRIIKLSKFMITE